MGPEGGSKKPKEVVESPLASMFQKQQNERAVTVVVRMG
jgi:hypothetical protein